MFQILIFILLFGWLRVAEILNNPFGKNNMYDINLATTLDVDIWKASLLLESQENYRACHLFRNDENITRDRVDIVMMENEFN